MLELMAGQTSHMRSGVRLKAGTVSVSVCGCLDVPIPTGVLIAVVISGQAAGIGDVVF